MKVITTNSPEAQEIFNYLKTKLEIPESVVGFSLHFQMDSVLTISNMEYHPKYIGNADE